VRVEPAPRASPQNPRDVLGESDEFRKLRRAIEKAHGDSRWLRIHPLRKACSATHSPVGAAIRSAGGNQKRRCGLRDPIVVIPCTTFAAPTAEGWDCGQLQGENDGRRARDVLAANRARPRLMASTSTPDVGASSVAACRAFDDACGVVQQCLDFRG
jgi:hypothetical protein